MNIKHHRHYGRYRSAKRRCYDKRSVNYKNYGGRGITMAEEFLGYGGGRRYCEYIDTLPGYAPGKTIDRIDNDKGYERGNLRWATPVEQRGNRRKIKRYGKGYSWYEKGQDWQVTWCINNKTVYFGRFKTEAEARKKAAETCPGKYLFSY